MADLLQAFRDHLVANSVCRKPSVAGPLPPMWLEPRNGVPAPGEGDNPTEVGATLVLGAFMAPGIVPQPYEGFVRTDGVEVWIRASNAALVRPLENQIRGIVNDRRNFSLGSLWVESMYLFRDLQPVDRGPQGFTFSCSYLCSLWGPPLAPPSG